LSFLPSISSTSGLGRRRGVVPVRSDSSFISSLLENPMGLPRPAGSQRQPPLPAAPHRPRRFPLRALPQPLMCARTIYGGAFHGPTDLHRRAPDHAGWIVARRQGGRGPIAHCPCPRPCRTGGYVDAILARRACGRPPGGRELRDALGSLRPLRRGGHLPSP